ncbi:hypothetical protein FVB32_14155 [Flagellimonas hymeniacidonis]|uniref:ParB/Sulfiredoxin domain-containing protein n=1 Tax=Flagellimonas hymeniacidonis TaxID=2603628 RepID=A0A5C8V3V6_9FLAO|nr:hypothetical protein [Flagellimonas hymeniacidonis]TXN35712.1 hypothetical protein FVB32_14155 [Flagellimonas hymeniacidonis]
MHEITLKNVRDLLESGTLELVATQDAINLPILQRIYKKMKIGIEFANIRVKGSRIVDGHHRYICSELSKTKIGQNDWQISSTAVDCSWRDVNIIEKDYETPEMIQVHNERDAELNDVDINVLNDL